jgi:hypothetical protein
MNIESFTELFHAESSTGTVHFASDGGFKDNKVDPYCNQRQWVGDYWGKKWARTDKPVTCKRCIASAIKEGIMPAPKKRLTLGYRCRILPAPAEGHSWEEYAGHDVLLTERSNGSFSCMVLGQKELKKEDSKTVINQVAWVDEDEMEFVNADLETNMEFIDWYQEHEEEFCGDCGTWFPDNGGCDPETKEDCVCPNEKCMGRLYDAGKCPYCAVEAVNDICPKCDFDLNSI